MRASVEESLKSGGTIGIYALDECGKISLAPGRSFTFYGGGYDEAETHEAVLKFYRAGKLPPSGTIPSKPSLWRISPRRLRPSRIGRW